MNLTSARNHVVINQNICHTQIWQRFQCGVKRREIGFERDLQQSLKRGNHKIALLIIINPVIRAHHAGEVKAQSIGARIIKRELAFAVT